MAKFTFLEVHLEGSSLAANAPFSSGDPGDDPAAESVPEPDPEADDGGGRRGVATVVGVLFLLVVALAVRKWVTEDEEIDLSAE